MCCFFGFHQWAEAHVFGDRLRVCEHCMAFDVQREDEAS